MVIFGLTVIISKSTGSTTAVSALILTFLVPAVLFSAVAGVFVDRIDRRLVLIVTNILRGLAFVAVFFVGNNLVPIYLLNIFISTVTVFFAPAEAAMIPMRRPAPAAPLGERGLHADPQRGVRPRASRCSARSSSRSPEPQALIVLVAVLYFVAAAFCSRCRRRRRRRGRRRSRRAGGRETEKAVAVDPRPSCARASVHPRSTARSAGR